MKDRIVESVVTIAICAGCMAVIAVSAIPTLIVIAIGKISGRNYLDERYGDFLDHER
uniref:Uncharacterized protein n=1 Tax=viral metagenome TaxID=1070528 RepID=A0A6M3J546_9ZZZZ